ncbi:hypothetical protein VQ042_24415 [Aurantimonas sp. A2-1-M11]|uniref:hypothetical protein n=1 Tax=Aurantimonas sp. A2-1-M11 TaxID=3113712 RepID=UPI002F93B311
MIRSAIAAVFLATALPATSAFAEDWKDAAIARIPQSHPMVVDASWGQNGSLRLYVEDNGYNRDGLAETACGSLKYIEGSPPSKFVIVRVFNAGSADAEKGSEMLGYGECTL